MECLRDYIGVRWCSGTTPPSGIYINDSVGISFKQLSAIANDEQKTAIGAWTEIQTRGLRRFANSVNAELNKRYAIFNIKHSYNLNRQIDTTSPVAPANDINGFTVQLRRDANDIIESYLASIYVQSLSYFAADADAGTEVEFMIYDLTSGEKLFTDTVTLVAGWNKIEVNEVFSNDFMDNSFGLFCCFDSSTLLCVSKEIDVENFYDCSLRFKGATTTLTEDITLDDITQGVESYGLTGIVSSVCKWDALVCQNKETFADALLHALEIETDLETIYSERFNRFTTTGVTKSKELLDIHTELFDKAVKQACEGVYIDKSDACLDCNETYQLKEVHP